MQPPVFDKFQNEDRDFKSIGKSLWVYFAVMLAITIPFSYIDNGLSAIISIITILITIFYCKRKTKIQIPGSIYDLNCSVKELGKYFILMTGFSMAAILFISIISTVFTTITNLDIPQADFTFDFSSLSGWLFLFYVCLIGPIFEEVLFRGAILRTLNRYNRYFAIIASALIFGLFHLYLEQGAHAFVLGLVLAYASLKTDSLMVPILLHIFHNTLTTFTSFSMSLTTIDLLFRFACMIVALIWLSNHIKDLKKEYQEDPISYPFFSRLFLRFSFISWFVLFILETVVSFIVG